VTTARRGFFAALTAAGAALAQRTDGAASAGRAVYNVTDFGAAGDGVRLDTQAIQKAIELCHQSGGGTVLLPPGRYLSGTIELKSNVALRLEMGATLLGSTNLADYPERRPAFRSYTDHYTDKSLLYAEKAENIAICGHGRLDGQGKAFSGPYKVRPYMIRIIECRGVTVTGIHMVNSPMWVQHYLACENVMIRGIRVHSRVNHNNDGIDIDCSDRVSISGCEISSGDDAIVLKSTADRPTRNVAISNCVLSTACNALKLGTESNGGFSNIAISNCTIYDTRLAGIALEAVDGGALERVSVSNIVMDGVGAPVFLRLGNRARPYREGGPKPGISTFRDVIISDVQATRCGPVGCALSGIPNHFLEDVTLRNLRLRFVGGGAGQLAWRTVPEEEDKYPEFKMFGDLPAFALYCRHMRGLRIDGLEVGFDKPDERPAVVFEDVEQARIENSRALHPMPTFLRVRSGRRIAVCSNDFTGVAQPVDGERVQQRGNFR
jgi:polygalacturonase